VVFVASMAASLVMMPVIWVLMIPMMLVGGLSSGHESNAAGCVGVLAVVLMMLVYAVMVVGLMMVLVPLKIRASLTQDFAKSFDFNFVKRFVALTWKEIVLSSIFVMVAGLLLTCLGLIIFCVGACFASLVSYFSWTHLHKQLYALYLSRGGEPIPLSPKLSDAPPAMPGA
jgi:hypothetical protein